MAFAVLCFLYLCIGLLQFYFLHRYFNERLKNTEFETHRAHLRINNMQTDENLKKTVVFKKD